MVSLFGGRRPLRPILGTQALAQVMVEVRSEDELRRALTPKDVTASPTVGTLLAGSGRRIVIAAPITLKSTVIIPATMAGVTIEAHGYLPIYPGVDGIDAFDIRAPFCTLMGLLVYSDPINAGPRWGRAFVLSGSEVVGIYTVTPSSVRIIDCSAVANQFIEDETSLGAGGLFVDRCSHDKYGDDVNTDGITINSRRCRVTFTETEGSGTGIAVRLGVDGGDTVVLGNNFHGDGVDTASSFGRNVISTNTDAGTIANHATDAVGLNT